MTTANSQSKLLMKSLLLISLTSIAIGSMGITSVAQTDTQATPNSTPSLPLLQAAPLVRAISKLLAQQSYEIESKIKLTGNLPDRALCCQC